MSESEPVVVVRDGSRGELLLNRPERKNAINGPLVSAFTDGLGALVADEAIGVILVRGAEGSFSSGLDLKDMSASPAPAWRAGFSSAWAGLHRELYLCPKPVVAAVESYAINAGAALALAADFLVIGDESFLQVGEVLQGVAAPMNLVWLRLKASRPVTNEVALRGQRITGPDLYRLGLACRSVPDPAVVETARALADELAGSPPGGKAAAKELMRALEGAPVNEDTFRTAQELGSGLRRPGPLPSLKDTR